MDKLAFMRSIPDFSDLLLPIKDTIQKWFIPVITGGALSSDENVNYFLHHFDTGISLSKLRWHSANADVIADVKIKIKIIVSQGTFLPTWFFLPLQKFKTIKIKLENKTYAQANTCLLHIISKDFKDIFKYICFSLYLWQTVNNWESAIIFIDHRCLPSFFFNRY